MNSNIGIFNKNRCLAASNIKTQNYGSLLQDDSESFFKKYICNVIRFVPAYKWFQHWGSPINFPNKRNLMSKLRVFVKYFWFSFNFSWKTATKFTFVTQMETRPWLLFLYFLYNLWTYAMWSVGCCVYFLHLYLYMYLYIYIDIMKTVCGFI